MRTVMKNMTLPNSGLKKNNKISLPQDVTQLSTCILNTKIYHKILTFCLILLKDYFYCSCLQ